MVDEASAQHGVYLIDFLVAAAVDRRGCAQRVVDAVLRPLRFHVGDRDARPLLGES